MTTIHTYDPADAGTPLPELPPLPIGALVVGAMNLLQEAADLPQPRYITIHDHQDISCQFASEQASIRAVARWALRFGGVTVSEPIQIDNDTWTYCRTEFSYYGVEITVYTVLPAGPATPTPRSGDPR